jgi:REP element-mobilizing transposase RayT
MAFGYLLTFNTYGTFLHGDDRGSWRARRGYEPPNAPLRLENLARLRETPFTLHEGARDVVLQAIVGLANYRHWSLWAAHVRTEHVHAVVALPPEVTPMRAMADFKAYATRALRTNGVLRDKYWAERGHFVCLSNLDEVQVASEYVYERQGEPMARYSRMVM